MAPIEDNWRHFLFIELLINMFLIFLFSFPYFKRHKNQEIVDKKMNVPINITEILNSKLDNLTGFQHFK